MRIGSAIAMVCCLPLFAGCELMQPREDDPTTLRIAELERRLQALERIMNNQSLVELSQQVAALERNAAELRGRAETIEYSAEETASRQRQLYADLDTRIQALESGLVARRDPAASVDDALLPDQLPIAEGTDRDNYAAAFELLKQERYDMAATAFERFLVTFPDSELAGNAQYWLAESHYASERFEEALRHFRVVVDDYPRSRKVADALLKIGYCNYNLEKWEEARAALDQVRAEYPDTTAARLAGQYLKRMQSEGL